MTLWTGNNMKLIIIYFYKSVKLTSGDHFNTGWVRGGKKIKIRKIREKFPNREGDG